MEKIIGTITDKPNDSCDIDVIILYWLDKIDAIISIVRHIMFYIGIINTL